jgi:hypothetical protein
MQQEINRPPIPRHLSISFSKNTLMYCISFITPLLFAIYPSLFHYANNAAMLRFSSLTRMLIIHTSLAAVVYVIFLIIIRHPYKAAIASALLLVFYNIYGILYNFLFSMDIVRIDHFTLLPFVILIVIYTSSWLSKMENINSVIVWKLLTFIIFAVAIFNLVKIISFEWQKVTLSTYIAPDSTKSEVTMNNNDPDIYYLVFDEFSGFEPMRNYWKYEEVDDFVNFLKSKEFFVAENSHSVTGSTIYELSTRLNYLTYPCCDQTRTYLEAIANNRAANYLKDRGYSTIAFEEIRSIFPTDISFQFDYLFENDPSSPSVSSAIFDEFGVLVISNTMLSAFSRYYLPHLNDQGLVNHRNMIYFTIDKLANLSDIPNPKFVYVHLLLPHVPFMFDEYGNVLDEQYQYNWNYYLGNYIFSIRVIREMVNTIFSISDPNRPPVIILQSDHGARNQIIGDNKDTLLQNFPESYKTSILFSLSLPGCDTSAIPQDIDPINTLPIVFNCYFGAGIPLVD